MNAFMLWAREFRGKLAEQMPNASNAEISVGLGQVWANLPTLEKQHFYLEAERVKNQHRRDCPGTFEVMYKLEGKLMLVSNQDKKLKFTEFFESFLELFELSIFIFKVGVSVQCHCKHQN